MIEGITLCILFVCILAALYVRDTVIQRGSFGPFDFLVRHPNILSFVIFFGSILLLAGLDTMSGFVYECVLSGGGTC